MSRMKLLYLRSPKFRPFFVSEHWRLWLGTIALSQAYSGTAPILVYEFDAGGFQGATNREVVRCRHGRLAVGQLRAADRCDA